MRLHLGDKRGSTRNGALPYDRTFPRETQLTPARKFMIDQRTDTTKVQLSESWALLGLLKGVWVRVTHRSRNDSKTAAPPEATPAWVTVYKS